MLTVGLASSDGRGYMQRRGARKKRQQTAGLGGRVQARYIRRSDTRNQVLVDGEGWRIAL